MGRGQGDPEFGHLKIPWGSSKFWLSKIFSGGEGGPNFGHLNVLGDWGSKFWCLKFPWGGEGEGGSNFGYRKFPWGSSKNSLLIDFIY